MSEPNLDVLTHQVEIALEEGDLETAAKLLESATAEHGSLPKLVILGRRIQEVRHLARQPTLDSLVRQSQERIRAADYDGAILMLRQAMTMAPQDEGLRTLVEQTQKAAARHSAAVERQNALAVAVRDIEGRLGRFEWTSARNRLNQALSEHGRHSIFDELEAKIRAGLSRQQQDKALEHVARAVELQGQGDWHGMFHQADQALTLAPDSAQASELRAQARQQLDRIEGQRQFQETVQATAKDVERLIEARELVRAEHRLTRAVEELGRHDLFSALAKRVDQAKKSQDIERRSEWAERRTKEADSLIQEAARLSLGNQFQAALDKLAAAQQLDPDHSEIESRRRDYQTALDRHSAQQERSRALEADAREIASALDGLHLDQAAGLLQRAREQHGEHRHWQTFERRLQGLRQAEEVADQMPTPDDLPKYGIATKRAIRRREQAVAGAYSWKQALLYPVRGPAQLVVAIGICALSAFLSLSLGGTSWIVPVVALMVTPILVGTTLEGKNQPAGPTDRQSDRPVLSVILGLSTFTVVSGLGAAGILFAARALPQIAWWLLAASLLWSLCVLLVIAAGVGSAFGAKHSWRVHRHLSCLGSDPPSGASLWLIGDALFLVVAVALILRATLTPLTPALGIPLQAVWEGYALLLIPHLIGVLIRSRRLDWANGYA